ncbi:MAG: redoxin domain-containing protein [Candidatus Ozemobacteraceae bacterium]
MKLPQSFDIFTFPHKAFLLLAFGILFSNNVLKAQTASFSETIGSPSQFALSSGTQEIENRFLAAGATAPSCVLTDLSGERCRFPVVGRWNLVLFWSLFCHSCLEEIPVVAAETANFQSLGVDNFFVALDTVRMKTGLENYVKKRNLKIRILLEEIASEAYLAADQWGVKTTPCVFLVDPTGKVIFSREGPFDLEELWAPLRQASGNVIASASSAPPHPVSPASSSLHSEESASASLEIP